MLKTLIAILTLILFAAGCVQPVATNTPPAAVSPSPNSTIVPTDEPTLVPTDTATASATALPSETSTATATVPPTPTREPSFTPTITHTTTPSATWTATSTVTRTPIVFTPGPTGTADQVNMDFSPAIIVTFDGNPIQHCMLTFYDVTLQPGFIGVWRRDKGGYFSCVQ